MIKKAILFCLLAPFISAEQTQRFAAFKEKVKPLFEKHCNRCHGGEKTKGDVDLTIFTDNKTILENGPEFLILKEAILNGDMPPKPKKTGYTDNDSKVIISWIEQYIEKNDFTDPVYHDPGPSIIRQLTTDEYNRTVKTLLNLNFDVNKEVGLAKEHNIHVSNRLDERNTMVLIPCLYLS